ncbi:MAG: methionyl-tRNA formyltransferase [Patescibacteria group bacterium]
MIKPIKIIFCGTPDFSVPYLEGLISDPAFWVVGIITQSDKPSGRDQKPSPSPVKSAAIGYGLRIWQPEKLKSDEIISGELSAVGADLLVVVAYGQIIPASILALFPRGAINVHPSLLPKYRGASPIQSALLAGESETGITIMLMDEKMDHGPILSQLKVKLAGEETNGSLHEQLAETGVSLLLETIKKYLNGDLKSQEQNHDEATYCATITKADGRIDWTQSAQTIKRKLYALYPWPAVWTAWGDQRIKFFPPAEIVEITKTLGEVFEVDGRLAVSAGTGSLIIDGWQLAGKNRVKNEDFFRGFSSIVGQKLQLK